MNRSILIAIVMAVIATIWILSGSISSSDTESDSAETTTDQNDATDKNTPFKVQVRKLIANEMADRIELQGGIEPAREIEIRAETHGTIRKLNAEKGDRLEQGATILNISLNDRAARLKQAKAMLDLRESDLEAGLKLQKKNLFSSQQHQQNLSNVAAAEAQVSQIEVEIEHTSVESAFAGILNHLYVEQGDYVSSGDPLATLVDDKTITITAEVPQQHIAKVRLGQTVEAMLLNGTLIEGVITYISSSANPATRTFTMEAEARNTGKIQRFGQSANIKINLGTQFAHKISPSLLNLDSQGDLEVKGVDAQNRVIATPVEMLRSEQDGIWLKGLPREYTVITVGQGFVSPGEEVNPVLEDETDTSNTTETGADA